MTRVYVSFYSAGNLGDDLFVHFLASRSNHQFETTIRRGSKTLRHQKNLVVHRDLIPRLLDRLFPRAREISRTQDLELRRVAASDRAVVVGGSLFIEKEQVSSRQQVHQYQSFSSPFFILGSNVGPVKTATYIQSIKNIFAMAAGVILRDRRSWELLDRPANVHVGTDILFALQLPDIPQHAGAVSVSVIEPAAKGFDSVGESYYQAIASFTSDMLRDGHAVTLFAFCPFEGDSEAIRRVVSLLPASQRSRVGRHVYRGNIDETLELFLSAEYVLGSRFHAAVLGLLAGRKILPISYGHKLEHVLADAGYYGEVISMEGWDCENPMPLDLKMFKAHNVDHECQVSRASLIHLDEFLNS